MPDLCQSYDTKVDSTWFNSCDGCYSGRMMSYHHHDRWGSWSTRPWRVMDRWSGLRPQIWWWSNRKLFQSKTVAGGQARAQGKGPDESPWAWTMDWFDCGGTAKTVSLGPGKQAFCYCTQGIQTFTISDLHTTHFTYSCYFNFEFGRIIQGTFTWEWTWMNLITRNVFHSRRVFCPRVFGSVSH